MPRDSSGNHALPPGTLVNTGDIVLVSQHNPAMLDLSQSLTNSLDRQGKGGMLAPLEMNGYPVRNISDGVNANDAATVGQVSSIGFQVGDLKASARTTPEPGWMACGGQELSRSEYADLFSAIGTSYGTGNGSTTFNIPDFRGRVIAGRDFPVAGSSANRLTNGNITPNASTLGASGGAQSVTLTDQQMPAHTHTGSAASAGAHVHGTTGTMNASNGNENVRANVFGSGDNRIPPTYNRDTLSAGAHTHSLTISSAGGGQAHSNVQPTIIANIFIKVSN